MNSPVKPSLLDQITLDLGPGKDSSLLNLELGTMRFATPVSGKSMVWATLLAEKLRVMEECECCGRMIHPIWVYSSAPYHDALECSETVALAKVEAILNE